MGIIWAVWRWISEAAFSLLDSAETPPPLKVITAGVHKRTAFDLPTCIFDTPVTKESKQISSAHHLHSYYLIPNYWTVRTVPCQTFWPHEQLRHAFIGVDSAEAVRLIRFLMRHLCQSSEHSALIGVGHNFFPWPRADTTIEPPFAIPRFPLHPEETTSKFLCFHKHHYSKCWKQSLHSKVLNHYSSLCLHRILGHPSYRLFLIRSNVNGKHRGTK